MSSQLLWPLGLTLTVQSVIPWLAQHLHPRLHPLGPQDQGSGPSPIKTLEPCVRPQAWAQSHSGKTAELEKKEGNYYMQTKNTFMICGEISTCQKRY